MHIDIPEYVREILARLRSAGFLAYPVGGCVRDALLGREPHDWDIATSALPNNVKAALAGIKTFDTGLQHGTITAHLCGHNVEITTFRDDGEYHDGRRPESVTLGATPERDLARRDFTINAMMLGEDEIIDPFGGQADLRLCLVRAVGVPEARFREDGLRVLRALRFAAVLGFEIERETARAARDMREMLKKIAGERIREELVRLLEGEGAAQILREYAEIFTVFLPEIAPAIGFEQNNPHHCFDVWQHTLAAVDSAPRDWKIRLALLLHDLGKPRCYSEDENGVGHFYTHAEVSLEIAHNVVRRLRLDGKSAEVVTKLVKYHDAEMAASEKSVARWLARLGESDLCALIAVKRADNAAQSPEYHSRQLELDEVERVLDAIIERNACVSLKDLAVKGGDIVLLGAAGAKIGAVLNSLLSEVIDGELENEKNALLSRARGLLDENEDH